MDWPIRQKSPLLLSSATVSNWTPSLRAIANQTATASLRLNIRALEPALRTAGQWLGKASRSPSRRISERRFWSANGNIMLYLSNGWRDQKQAKVLLFPKSLSKMVWWTRARKISVMSWRWQKCGEFDTASRTIRSSCCFRWSDDNQVTFPLIHFLVCYK